jgi:hypothetical protein
MENEISPVVQMPLYNIAILIAMHLGMVCDPVPPGVGAAADLLARAVYAIAADHPGDMKTMTREDAMLWTGIISEAVEAVAQGLYEAHFAAEDAK